MKTEERKPQVVTVERELYEKMTEAFRRVKLERLKNKQFADDLDKRLKSLNHELGSFSSKIGELVIATSNLNEDVQRMDDYTLKTKLGKKTEALTYGVMTMQDKSNKLTRILKDIRDSLRPYRDYKGGG